MSCKVSQNSLMGNTVLVQLQCEYIWFSSCDHALFSLKGVKVIESFVLWTNDTPSQ